MSHGRKKRNCERGYAADFWKTSWEREKETGPSVLPGIEGCLPLELGGWERMSSKGSPKESSAGVLWGCAI